MAAWLPETRNMENAQEFFHKKSLLQGNLEPQRKDKIGPQGLLVTKMRPK